ncbi:hypothetical protein DFA_05973 [Cavenderia fasciculata]|uniref:F-box domain-containing protein n=1 Tax=Cavenderia fasciculata TaxID=261658 RepID=F4PJR3_CACFS|nr:uncharacterized protein DFA_05973 [Cavenderia fasciculata]EGG23837.1 hypothetical protein DFA_05973 [Cavenderia fasciculata]|eukprot:XP_004361688.1 hypothetical protein DFA_05973 [Cavenderia fasciculata]
MKDKQRKEKRQKQRNKQKEQQQQQQQQQQEQLQKRLQEIQIPVYVTQIIVNLLFTDCVIDNDTYQLLSLASVCKKWFDIVKSALQSSTTRLKPSFPMPDSVRYERDFVVNKYYYPIKQRQRSAYALCQYPTRLNFTPGPYWFPMSNQNSELLVSVSTKIRELEIQSLEENTINRELLALPMPELESLRVKHTTEFKQQHSGPILRYCLFFEMLLDMDKQSPKLANLKSIEFRSVFPFDADECTQLFQQCQLIESVDISDDVDPPNDGFEMVLSALSVLPRLTKLTLSRFGSTMTNMIPNTVTSISIHQNRTSTPEFREYVERAKHLRSLDRIFLSREWLRILAHTQLTKLYFGIDSPDDIDIGSPLIIPTLETLVINMRRINESSAYLYGFELDQLPRLRKLYLLQGDGWDYVTDLISRSKSIKKLSTSIVGCTQTKCNLLFDSIQQSRTFKRLRLNYGQENSSSFTLIKAFNQYQIDHPDTYLVARQLDDYLLITNTNNHY